MVHRARKKIPYSAYLYVLPMVALMGVFIYYPISVNFWYTLHSFSAFSQQHAFVGLDNLRALLTDPIVRIALGNNIVYCVISVLVQVFLALGIAAVLEDRLFRRFSGIFRTMFFLPVLISMTVVAMLFTQIYAPRGLLNAFLGLFGGSVRTGWTGRTDTAIFSAIAMSQWHSLGYTAMLFIVDIQKIPAELYEAAEIDGAGRWQRFIHITFPQAKEMLFVLMVTTVSGAFLVFNDVYILTRGGPGNASTTLSVYMYDMAFTQDRMGYASSVAILMFAICVLLTVVQKAVIKTGKGD